jgi:hypothetical protein
MLEIGRQRIKSAPQASPKEHKSRGSGAAAGERHQLPASILGVLYMYFGVLSSYGLVDCVVRMGTWQRGYLTINLNRMMRVATRIIQPALAVKSTVYGYH